MTPSVPSAHLVHRLLFRALLEMREQGHEQKNKVVFHLADLFHTTVLDLEAAAAGKKTYEEVFGLLEAKAREKGVDRWLAAAVAEVEGQTASMPVTS